MLKRGDLIYLHTLDGMDKVYGAYKGVYTVRTAGIATTIYVEGTHTYFVLPHQYHRIIPNKINKLLYKELK